MVSELHAVRDGSDMSTRCEAEINNRRTAIKKKEKTFKDERRKTDSSRPEQNSDDSVSFKSVLVKTRIYFWKSHKISTTPVNPLSLLFLD
jgi:hypothetical protein